VASDNIQAGYLATRHLIARKPGRPVICVDGPRNVSPSVARLNGYRQALREAGMPFEECYVFRDHYGLQDAFDVCESIVKTVEPPFSVFCSTDLIAMGVLRGLHAQGLCIPGDVGVIGVDDIEMAAYLTPALSTVSLPKELIGEQSAEILINLMEGRKVEQPIRFLAPELIVRETT
jgi:DNA-binding LacI/PurR family transcriptional regulator